MCSASTMTDACRKICAQLAYTLAAWAMTSAPSLHAQTAGSPLQTLPTMAMLDVESGQWFAQFDDYRQAWFAQHPQSQGRPWVGLIVEPSRVREGDIALPRALLLALQARGLNVAPLFGRSLHEALRHFYLDSQGQSRIAAMVLLPSFNTDESEIGAILQQLDVPIINAIALRRKTRQQWQDSPFGLTQGERFYQVFGAELIGATAPTIVATDESVRDARSGRSSIAQTPVPDRVQRLADRVRKLVALRTTPPADQRVALMYYNDEPGPAHIEADYLNVPRSLWQTLLALSSAGYTLGRDRPDSYEAFEAQLLRHGVNVATPGALAELVDAGKAVLLPLSTYRRWLSEQPATLRQSIETVWGQPEDA